MRAPVMVDGETIDLSEADFIGGMQDVHGDYEDLLRLSDGRWLLYFRYVASMAEAKTLVVTDAEAVDWLIELRQSESAGYSAVRGRRSARRTVPEYAVPREDHIARQFSGRLELSGPPPLGQVVEIELPETCSTYQTIRERQDAILQPMVVLERVLWPRAADETLTQGFAQKSHDELLARLRERLEECLITKPQISTLQSLADRGCDQLLEYGVELKCGIQLKSHGDIKKKDFRGTTLSQIQDSRQHGLSRLYAVLAGDLTDRSQREKVRGLQSDVSSMNDEYVKVIPPERAWNILYGA